MSGMHFENELFRETQLRNHWRNTISYFSFTYICDALRDFVPFVQFQKHEKHLRRSVTFITVEGYFLPKS